MITLRILIWRDDPGLSGWVLSVIIRVLIGGRQVGQWEESSNTMMEPEMGVQPGAEKCRLPGAPGRGMEGGALWVLQKEPALACTLIVTP